VSDSVEAGPRCRLQPSGRSALRRLGARSRPSVSQERGVLVSGMGAREGLTAKGAHPESRNWRRNSLKRLNLRPELVWAWQPGSPKIWYWRANIPGRLSPDGRGNERPARRTCAAVGRPEMAPQDLEIVQATPGDGMASHRYYDAPRGQP
jgi:hypothetical protein